VGFSFGAVLAAGTAARLGSRLTTLTLVGPGGFGAPSGRNLNLRSLPPGGSPDEVRAVLRHNLLRMMLADPASLDDQTLAIHQQNFRRSRFDSRRISLQSRLLDDLRHVRCPLQLIWGALDQLAYPSVAERAALCRQVRPDLHLDVIPSAGHWVQYEQSAVFNEAVMRFALGASQRSPAQGHEPRPS
jgi:pimeloyl-ACP methyl ester carboxylesterase